MPRTAFFGAVLLACSLAPDARAADAAVLPGESRGTAARLAEAHKKIDEKNYTEAINDLQAILDTAGNDLVPVTPQRCVQARRLCHRELALLPPDALREYRARVDPQAKKWLDAATPARDVRLLRRIVDEAFCSQAGQTATELLGDLAFERGHFDEAVVWWRMLARPLGAKKDNPDDSTLHYPDVQGDKAPLYAKQIVALQFGGATEAAARALMAFQKEYPNAEGSLAGRSGKYVDLLATLLKETPSNSDKAWTTFGGDATRGLVLPAPPGWLDRLAQTVKGGPTYRFDLATRTRRDDSPPPPVKSEPASTLARQMAFQPLICGDYVLVSDARYLAAYDLRTGKATTWFDILAPNKDNKEVEIYAMAAPNLKLPTEKLDLRYTMTAADSCLYVRFGAQDIARPDDGDRNEAEKDKKSASFLACFSLDPAAKERLRWCMRPIVQPNKPVLAQRNAIFEGAPLVYNGSLYVAVTWFEGDRTITAIQCYPTGTETAPQWRWQQTICETRELKAKEQRTRHHLLTVAGPNVVYCSHSGAIVAVDALTGKTAWAVRYPSTPATNADEPSLRDLTPCLYAAGRLYVAPADYDRLLCLDPLTGETVWEREQVYATHLLGVGQGQLIYTTLKELHGVNAADGSNTGGWVLRGSFDDPFTPMGRGFLMGDLVVWPTDKGIFVRRQENGDPAEYNPVVRDRILPGNLVYSNGILAVADRTTLSVFVPQEPVPPKLPKDMTHAPPPPSPAVAVRLEPPRKPASGADFALPLERTSALVLEDGERILFLAEDDLLTGQEGGTVRLRSATAGKEIWNAKLSFASTWAEQAGNAFVVGGQDGVAVLRKDEGARVWEIRARDQVLDSEPAPALSGFRFAGGRLFFLQDDERLFAVDVATGRVLWSQWATGAKLNLTAPLGHYQPTILATATTLLVQPTPGLIWLLDAATGKRLHEETHRFEPWPRPPVSVDGTTSIVVLDSRTVARFDLTTGKPLWTHVIPHSPLLSGEAPQFVVDAENMLLLTPNNLGCTLQRLDIKTGKPLWDTAPLLEPRTPLDAAGWSLDDSAVYFVQDRMLTARSLDSGKVLWRQALPDADGDWRTRRLGDAVLAYPASTEGRRLQFRWVAFSVQWEMDHSREVGVGRGLPVICCDARNGHMKQRLNLLAGPPRVQARLGPFPRIAAPLDTSPRFWLTRSDLAIAIDSTVWRYSPKR